MIPTNSSSSQPFPWAPAVKAAGPVPGVAQRYPPAPLSEEETAVTGRGPERGWWVKDMEIQTQLCWTQSPHVLLGDLPPLGLAPLGARANEQEKAQAPVTGGCRCCARGQMLTHGLLVPADRGHLCTGTVASV